MLQPGWMSVSWPRRGGTVQTFLAVGGALERSRGAVHRFRVAVQRNAASVCLPARIGTDHGSEVGADALGALAVA